MQDITQELVKKKIDYDKLFKTCGYLLDYLSDPEQTVKKLFKELDIPSNSDNDTKEFVLSLKDLDKCLTSVFTKEHAIAKGRDLIKDTIKKYENNLDRSRQAMNDSIKVLSDSIKEDINLIFTTIELNNPLRNLKMITEGKEMIRNYFESRLTDFNKSETVAGFGDTLSKLNVVDIFAILPNILGNGIETYSSKLQQKIDIFRKSSALIQQLHTGKHSNPGKVYDEQYPIALFAYPKISFIKYIAAETKEYKTYNTVAEAFYNLILHLVTSKNILRDKAKILTDYLDELSTCDTDLDLSIMHHMLNEGIYRFEKQVITLEEASSIFKFDMMYIETLHTINTRHMNGLFRSAMNFKALTSLYVELSNYVYKALDKVV